MLMLFYSIFLTLDLTTPFQFHMKYIVDVINKLLLL